MAIVCDSRNLFDPQGETYDQRAGLSERHGREIARAAIELAEADPGDLVVEVGAGTGSIGRWLAREARYAGFDVSQGMLETFRRRSGKAHLVLADGRRPWPLAGATARLIFSSRAIHWLDAEHAAREICRVARPAGAFLCGRVERRPDSVRFRMRQRMRRELGRRGVEGRRAGHRQLIDLCCLRGARVIVSRVASRWKVSSSPRQSIEAWRGKPGLAGLDPPADLKRDVLRRLEDWAEATFGGLDREVETEETYVLEGVRLPAEGF